HGAPWSTGAPLPPSEPAPASEAPSVYDASGELAPGDARAVLAFQVPRAEQAVAVAPTLADPRGPLVSRLRALEAAKEAPKVRELVATAHARGGCLSVTLDFHDLGSEPAARIATAVALTRQEVSAELGDAVADDTRSWDTALALARRAGDPREAAERAAWWALVRPGADRVVRVALAVGITNGRDAPVRNASDAIVAPSSAAAALTPLRQEIERAVAATSAPVVEGKIKIEKGQSDLWLLFASPCGTLPEVDLDAGLGATFAFTAVEEARARSGTRIELEPFAASDGIGVLAHAAAIPGEPPTALARRVADAAARSFAADPIDPVAASRARTALLSQASESVDGRSLVQLAHAIAPGHPSWFLPTGTFEALGRSSDAMLYTRSAALRSGALRVSVIANTDAAQAAAAVRAVDRWVTRRAGESRTCPTPSAPPPPRPGTYAIDATGNPSEAWIAIPLVSPTSAPDEAGRTLASWTASLLDGPDGLLARALGPAALARAWSAKVIGPPRAAALVIRITSGQAALDAAVAQTRVLLARLQKGAIDEGERARAIALRQRADLQRALDPRARLVALWRGEPDAPPPPPSLEALRAFAGATLKDDALVIVAARAPRPVPAPSTTPSTTPSSAKAP
ncbi:MAG: exonuclease SbcC, partial [Myxococcaceae bacterium]|nr:exonuclease SbcC [Myxococcaceae bacterium]